MDSVTKSISALGDVLNQVIFVLFFYSHHITELEMLMKSLTYVALLNQ